jgi:hypothetical protein
VIHEVTTTTAVAYRGLVSDAKGDSAAVKQPAKVRWTDTDVAGSWAP